MLTVHLHLLNGQVIREDMTRSQKDRLSKTMNLSHPPERPYVAMIAGECVEVPWRSICYLSSVERAVELALVDVAAS